MKYLVIYTKPGLGRKQTIIEMDSNPQSDEGEIVMEEFHKTVSNALIVEIKKESGKPWPNNFR